MKGKYNLYCYTRVNMQKMGIKNEGVKINTKESTEVGAKASVKENVKKNSKVRIAKKRTSIEEKAQFIPDTIETTYYNLREEQIKFFSLARRLALACTVTKLDDTNIFVSINKIKNSIPIIVEQLQKIKEPSKLEKIDNNLEEIENLSKDSLEKVEYSKELNEILAKSFDSKVQELVRNSKIENLEKQIENVERQKISIFGKIAGKAKLKSTKITNLELKKQLLMFEMQNEKFSYILEDSLSDLYSYLKDENVEPNTQIQEFLDVIENDKQIVQMIDMGQVEEKMQEKIDKKNKNMQLIPIESKKKVSIRNEVNIMQLQNNELGRQIQNNRAKTITNQNRLSTVQDNSYTLNNFQKKLDKINGLLQI